MSEPFIAEIRIFAGNFAPRGWAFCNGQLLPISQNTALFSLVGTTYGGDGRSTLALPDLQGRAPMHPGRGPGLTDRRLGQRSGSETISLTEAQMPNHTHNLRAYAGRGDTDNPTNAVLAESGDNVYKAPGGATLVPMEDAALEPAGGSQPHNNMQPYLTLNFIIALVGLYPSRS
ncbi:MAG: phage tail protein [Chloroflexi bacterium]|nr:MAG: phage tail protein [Chloroflexota bacterium]